MPAVNYVIDGFILAVIDAPLPRQKAGLSFTASGYGAAIPTSRIVKCADGKTRRVYATCYGNAASVWIRVNGGKQYLHDYQLA